MTLLIGLAAFAATLLGGFIALRLKDRLHLITGFSAGAILGVAFFDLLPESAELLADRGGLGLTTLLLGTGFAGYMVLDRMILLHGHAENGCANARHRGIVGACSLAGHSFFDGVAIGLAFQVSTDVGWIVTLAVLAHDLSDGVNTVNVMLKGSASRTQAARWLLVDAAAPLLGVASTYLIAIPQEYLGAILAVMCGFFLYIGASDLLPESHHAHPKRLTTVMTLAGIASLYAVIRLAG